MRLLLFSLIFLSQINLFSQDTTALISIGEKFSFFSKILNEEREIYLHIPQGLWRMDETIKNLTFNHHELLQNHLLKKKKGLN
ncbi:MAG: hypothetical protein AB8G22_27135 [Saprospiraceae bacterium]